MTTVAHKAFYCTYTPLALAGVLTRPAGQCLFLEPESGAVITLSAVEVYRDVVINGTVADAMAQYLDDKARGGAPGSRAAGQRGGANGHPHLYRGPAGRSGARFRPSIPSWPGRSTKPLPWW